jgi:hypothetical protein
VADAHDVVAGSQAHLVTILTTANGFHFCKGIHESGSALRGLRNEVRLNSWLPDVFPRMRWSTDAPTPALDAFAAGMAGLSRMRQQQGDAPHLDELADAAEAWARSRGVHAIGRPELQAPNQNSGLTA